MDLPASSPAGPRTRTSPDRRLAVVTALVTALALPSCSGIEAATPESPFSFERWELRTGRPLQQVVLTGAFLSTSSADLALLERDESGASRLRLFTRAGDRWQAGPELQLEPGIGLCGVVNLGGRDRVVVERDGVVSRVDLDSGAEHRLLAVETDWVPAGGEIARLPLGRDLNGDGRDDLVVPLRRGLWVAIQNPGGELEEPLRVGPLAETAGGRMPLPWPRRGAIDDPWGAARVHRVDWDLDGRPDLVHWSRDRFVVRRQTEDGRFAATTERHPTAVSFDSDDPAYLVAPLGVRGRAIDETPAGRPVGRVLHSLRDVDGDGISDLIVFSLAGGSLWRMRSALEVHHGRRDADGIAFAEEAGAAVRADGIPFGLAVEDVDGDGRSDLALTVLEPGLFKALGMLVSATLTGTVAMDLELHPLHHTAGDDHSEALHSETLHSETHDSASRPSASRHSAKKGPAAERTVRVLTPGDGGQETRFPAVLSGDVTGDGRPDLLIGKIEARRLLVYAGRAGPGGFAARPQKVALVQPGQRAGVWLDDVDGDGRTDVVVHGRDPGGELVVTVLRSLPEG